MQVELETASGRRCMLRGLLVRRERWSLSLPGKLLALAALAGLACLAVFKAQSFLAVTRPVPAEFLVAEGWLPDYAIEEVPREFQKGTYRTLLTSGSITKDGWHDVPKYTSAEWAAARLHKLGITNNLVAVPCRVERADRTYHSALLVRQWFDSNDVPVHGINVMTLGPHARRTRLLFEKAFGRQVQVGIIALEDRDYDPDHWWRSSDGVRQVVGEGIAYLYARIFFHPSE